MEENKICVKVNYRNELGLWEISKFNVGRPLLVVQYCVTEQEAHDFVKRWSAETGGRIQSNITRQDVLKKYGREWTRCHEDYRKIPEIWKVLDMPDGEELWEENLQGRLFLVKGDDTWVCEF